MRYFERFNKGKYRRKSLPGKIWYFIWYEDSVESWLINIALAFLLIKFIIYPGLGFMLATTHPIVAVVSGSMHHDTGFDDYWDNGGAWYEGMGITKSEFRGFPMHNGFNKGDIMILRGVKAVDANVGDIIVFQALRPDPIIHRIVAKRDVEGEYVLQTKGDNYRTNPDSINGQLLNEMNIREEQIVGKAFIRVPYLGYIKILAVDFACLFNDFNFCIKA
ncbi:MAG: signal peptidase I [Nanoarchaeota archaeon]|nr:signal peptidase I [Nanoarchaeota archaeon]